ncbi:YbjN domain-containing protein [Sphingomonas sp. 7/4-4]|uniref:YbjN domain-containing protein n=1 Tax=Sphingomonas sp. 7/4-4 TaxID=3018446 RepID=UPI0022F3F11C|nr:YbjN domain-containing protein [Sphingomonas sp. 7/4-4]WBY09795.1 YbjN domain-containing protein [Sphingomonas sp. 7/4-4]
MRLAAFRNRVRKGAGEHPEFVNKWNSKKRFLQAFVRTDGQLGVAYDVATIGGLNAANFADVLAWWNSQLAELADFFKEELNLPDAKADKPKS